MYTIQAKVDSQRREIELWRTHVSTASPSQTLMSPPATIVLDSDDESASISLSTSDKPTGAAKSTTLGTEKRGSKRPRERSSISPEPVARRRPSYRHTSYSTNTSGAPTHPSSPSLPDQSDASDVESVVTTGTSRQNKTMEKRRNNDLQTELAACIKRIKASKSPAYDMFGLPELKRNDDGEYTHYTFKCKMCGRLVPRLIGAADTSALLSHGNRCAKEHNQTLLNEFGITGHSIALTGDLIREYCALWVAENARPYSIINDRYLRKLFPRETSRQLPTPKTISKDIKRMYQMTQKTIGVKLQDIPGVFHIALDLFQSGNNYDYLGLVIFYPEVTKDKGIQVSRFVLECMNFGSSHTGNALARVVHGILCKFNIQDRVWGVVCDNASNNAAMMDRLKKFDLKRLEGPASRVHCMLHVLNLVADAINLPFAKKRKEMQADEDDDESDAESEAFDDAELCQDEDADVHDDGTAGSRMLGDGEDEEEPEDEWDISVPEMEAGSPEELEFRGVSKLLGKIAWFARKLRFSPRMKAGFKAICMEREAETPHNVRRDVKTRWNSTENKLADVDRLFDVIVPFQLHSAITRSRRLVQEDRKSIRSLLTLLKPLRLLTEMLSKSGVPMLADIIVHYDGLNYEYTKMCKNSTEPLWVRQAANRARLKLNKYYSATDSSDLYRMAIGLSPSLRVHYMNKAGWEQEWIDTAVELIEDCWARFYKIDAAPEETEAVSQFSYSSYMDTLYASLDDFNEKPANPVKQFVHGNIVIDRSKPGKCITVNPLSWWHAQRLAGEEHHGLTQMALDVLSTPATSVDVERAFSFAGSIVSKRRHKLAPYSIQATASLGSYSKAGLVEQGCLARARKQEGKGEVQALVKDSAGNSAVKSGKKPANAAAKQSSK